MISDLEVPPSHFLKSSINNELKNKAGRSVACSLLCFLQDFVTPVVLSWEPFCSLGDIWQRLQTFLAVVIIRG